MAVFDYSTLNSSDFEELITDLLNEENRITKTGIVFKTYRDGKDKGIDFRYSIPGNDNYIVGQAKHFLKSTVKTLLSELKKTERQKVKKLSPSRYIFATTADLTPQNEEEIAGIFTPYITGLSDIYGRKRINALLDSYPAVIDRHFKLWYSGTAVLQRVLQFKFIGRALEFSENYLRRKIFLYVTTPAYFKTRELLKKSRFVIITGDPGTGKTTLAEILTYEFIKDGYHLTYIYDDIRDIDKALRNDDSKQVFYFDDFLGNNVEEMRKAKSSESALLMIIKRIIHCENKFLIVTSRLYILNSFLKRSQKYVDFGIGRFESIIDLKKYYDQSVRLKILENHVEFSDMRQDLKNVLNDISLKLFIAGHDNFTPRSVEYITSDLKVDNFAPDRYKNFIKRNFNYPDEIWREAYLNEIGDLERFLINTMYSLGKIIRQDELEAAFEARLAYEINTNNFTRPMFGYKDTLRRLLGSFIDHENVNDGAGYFRFRNPSLVDFLTKFLAEQNDEQCRILASAQYITQVAERFYPIIPDPYLPELPVTVVQRIMKFDFELIKYEDYDHLIRAFLLLNYIKTDEAIASACECLLKIEDYAFVTEEADILPALKDLFLHTKDESVIITLNKIGMAVFVPVIDDESEFEEIIEICRQISNKFEVDDKRLLLDDSGRPRSYLQDSFFRQLEEELDDLKDYITSDSELEEVEEKYEDLARGLEAFGVHIMAFGTYFDYADWVEPIMFNQFRHSIENDKD